MNRRIAGDVVMFRGGVGRGKGGGSPEPKKMSLKRVARWDGDSH